MNAPLQIVEVDRARFLGGSDAAAILGHSNWGTPLSVYLWKIGEPTADMLAEKKAKAKLFRRGKREEPHIIDDLAEDYGIRITKRSPPEAPNRYLDPEHAFLSAEVDFEWEVTPEVAALVAESQPQIADLIRSLVGTTQNGEAKSVHHFAAGQFGESETEDVPIAYAAQAMHGLMVTGRQLCMFGVRVGNGDVLVYWIVRDDETIAVMRSRLVRFWTEHVEKRVAPDPMTLPDVLTLFGRAEKPIIVLADDIAIDAREVFPDREAEETVPLATVYQELELAKAMQKDATARIDDLKFLLGKAMLGEDKIERERKPRGGLGDPKPTPLALGRNHMLAFQGSALMVIALEQQTRLDNDAIREKHPEIVAECSRSIRFFKFRKPNKTERFLLSR